MAKNATKSRREGDSETIPGDTLRPTFDGQMKHTTGVFVSGRLI